MMNQINTSNQSAAANQVNTNTLAGNNFYVPCVPIAISASLVAAQPLSMRLAASAPELAHLSLTYFSNIQLKKSELRLKVDECAINQEALLDVCLLNVGDLFSNLAAYQLVLGKLLEVDDDEDTQVAVQLALKQVHAYAAAMDLLATDYCVDGVIHPEMLFDACLKRVQFLQNAGKTTIFSRLNWLCSCKRTRFTAQQQRA